MLWGSEKIVGFVLRFGLPYRALSIPPSFCAFAKNVCSILPMKFAGLFAHVEQLKKPLFVKF
jgi:hypothetical protein